MACYIHPLTASAIKFLPAIRNAEKDLHYYKYLLKILNLLPNSLRIAGGESSGLRVGDQLILADRHKLPSRALEAKALDQLALAEVQSVSGYYAELKQIAGPKLVGAAQWVAVPYSP